MQSSSISTPVNEEEKEHHTPLDDDDGHHSGVLTIINSGQDQDSDVQQAVSAIVSLLTHHCFMPRSFEIKRLNSKNYLKNAVNVIFITKTKGPGKNRGKN